MPFLPGHLSGVTPGLAAAVGLLASGAPPVPGIGSGVPAWVGLLSVALLAGIVILISLRGSKRSEHS